MLVAHGRIDHLADAELLDVARQHILQEGFGIRAGHLELPQRRQVHDHRLLAAGPVFLDRPGLAEGIGEPVALVLDEIAGVFREAAVKGGFAGHYGFCVGGHALRYGSREFFFARIGANVNVGKVPAIGRRGVVGAGRGDADKIGQRPQEHIVAGPRPGLVRDHQPVGVDGGVEKEIDRHPAGAGVYALVGQRLVEIVRAVGMAGIADVVIIFRRAGQREGVMAAAGVLHHLDQRLHVLVVVFRVQAGHRIARAHQRPRRRHVERMVLALVELARRKALEVGALAPVYVDDLDVVAGLDEIALRRRRLDPLVQQRIGQRIRKLEAVHQLRLGARDRHRQRRCRVMRVDRHRSAGCGDDQRGVALRDKALFGPCRRVGAENPHRRCFRQVDAAPLDLPAKSAQARVRHRQAALSRRSRRWSPARPELPDRCARRPRPRQARRPGHPRCSIP